MEDIDGVTVNAIKNWVLLQNKDFADSTLLVDHRA
jgi:hypothetical protein